MNDNERSALERFCHCCLLWKSIITIIVDLVFQACTWHLAGSFSQAAASSGTLWNVLSPSIMQIRNSQVCTSLHSALRLPFPICDPLAQSSGSCTWGGTGGGSDKSGLSVVLLRGRGLKDPLLHHPSPLSPWTFPKPHIPKGCSCSWHFLFPPLTFPGPFAVLTAGKAFATQTSSQGHFSIWIYICFGWFFVGTCCFSPTYTPVSVPPIPSHPVSHRIC